MTENETLVIMGILQSAFPSFYKGMGKKNAYSVASLWHQMFADDDFQDVQAAVKILLATKTDDFPPTIGAVKEKLTQLHAVGEMSAQDAWTLAAKAAAGNLSWEKLPPLVQKAIGSPAVLREWGVTDERAFHTVIYSQFIKAYKIQRQREREMAAIPAEVRDMLTAIADKMSLPERSELT